MQQQEGHGDSVCPPLRLHISICKERLAVGAQTCNVEDRVPFACLAPSVMFRLPQDHQRAAGQGPGWVSSCYWAKS